MSEIARVQYFNQQTNEKQQTKNPLIGGRDLQSYTLLIDEITRKRSLKEP